MLDGLITALAVGWFLTWFDFDKIFIEACNELFLLNITTATYYFIFAIIGLIGGLIHKL